MRNIRESCKVLLKPGVVFTIEPGIYTEGWGGIRIEDTVVWDPTHGIANVTKSSKDLLSI